jgi:hypothetical protein
VDEETINKTLREKINELSIKKKEEKEKDDKKPGM